MDDSTTVQPMSSGPEGSQPNPAEQEREYPHDFFSWLTIDTAHTIAYEIQIEVLRDQLEGITPVARDAVVTALLSLAKWLNHDRSEVAEYLAHLLFHPDADLSFLWDYPPREQTTECPLCGGTLSAEDLQDAVVDGLGHAACGWTAEF
ncbi:hypothetical protein VNI00_017742 [Paramarasmius palmivorus]|uniref:Uncharacterized protein n=1 Tax=Paramarasmius palmivorus TaxID=297713 RepID=A0AAW0B2Q3_9AGAR